MPAGDGSKFAPLRRLLGHVTPTGWGVFAGAVVLGVATGLLRSPELGVLAVGCVAALVTGGILVSRRSVLTVEIEVVPARVGRGEPAVASVTISNVGGRGSASLRLVLPHGADATEVGLRSLPSNARRAVAVALPTGRRGVLRVGPAGLLASDPFGLFARYQMLGEQTSLHVYPSAHPVAPLPSARSSSPDGLPVDSETEGGVTFHALRDYVPGDDPRHLHWRSSARTGTLLVRRHVDPSEPVTTVLLDTRRRAYPDDSGDQDAREPDRRDRDSGELAPAAFDAAVDVAASVLLASTRLRFPVRLHTTGGLRIACNGGRNDETVVLDALASVDCTAQDGDAAGDPLAEAVRGRGLRGVGSLVVVTGVGEIGQVESVGNLLGAFERVVVVRVAGSAGERAGTGTGTATGPVAAVGGGRLYVMEVADAVGLAFAWSTLSQAATGPSVGWSAVVAAPTAGGPSAVGESV
jgi:uncharacterized protein (DUF58 family)